MTLKEFINRPYLNNPHFYEEVVQKMGGPTIVEPYIPFKKDVLIESYLENRHFNTRLTPLCRWDNAIGKDCHNIWPLLRQFGITLISLSESVCILKTAAEMLIADDIKTITDTAQKETLQWT